MRYLLGIDIGTSSTKALLCDERGRIAATASAAHELLTPRAGWSEQDPECWWGAVCASVRGVLEGAGVGGDAVACVGLSGQMHGSVLLSERSGDGARALRPALLWNDQRTGAQCEAIERAAGGRRAMVETVGNAALTGFTLPKLLWVREHEPEVWGRVKAWCLPKDFIRLRLTGELATDVGDAAGTLLFDVGRRAWSIAAHEASGLDVSLSPRVLESCALAGRVSAGAGTATGLAPGTPVVAGSGDNQCGAVGAGVVEPGRLLATLGTSGVLYAHCAEARKDLGAGGGGSGDEGGGGAPAGRVHTMCAADGTGAAPGRWSLTGCMLSAAGSLQWLREALFPDVAYERLLGEAEAVGPGAGGLVFLPQLTGERCPYPDPSARGGFIGLTSRHTRGHLVRAVVEGVTLTMRQILDIFRGLGVEASGVRLGGGGARSAFWRQLQADVYGAPVELPNTEEGPALGAALMAGVGAGVWGDVAGACAAVIGVTETREPEAGRAARYGELLGEYVRYYPALKERFAALAAFDR